jgi:hypothetical protein
VAHWEYSNGMIFIKVRELLFRFALGGKRSWTRLLVTSVMFILFALMLWAGATVLLPDAIKKVRAMFEAESIAKGRATRVGRKLVKPEGTSGSGAVEPVDLTVDDEALLEGNGAFEEEGAGIEGEDVGLTSTPEKALALPTPKIKKKTMLTSSARELYMDMFITGKASDGDAFKFAELIEKGSLREGVDSVVVASIIAARSKMEAKFTLGDQVGYFAINPAEATAMAHFAKVEYVDEAQLVDPTFNLTLGLRYVGWLYRTLKNNERHVLVAFEMGFNDFLGMVKAGEAVPEAVQVRVDEVLRFKSLLQKRLKGSEKNETNTIQVEDNFGETTPATKVSKVVAKKTERIGGDIERTASPSPTVSATPMVEASSKLTEDVVPSPATSMIESPSAPPPSPSPSGEPQTETTTKEQQVLQAKQEEKVEGQRAQEVTSGETLNNGGSKPLRKLRITRDLSVIRLVLPREDEKEDDRLGRPGQGVAESTHQHDLKGKLDEEPVPTPRCKGESSCLELMLKDTELNSEQFRTAVVNAASKSRLSPILLVALAKELSAYDTNLISDEPIRVGLFQFVATDGSKIANDAGVAWAGSKELQNSDYAVKVAAGYLESLVRLTNGNLDLAICAFTLPYGAARQVISSKRMGNGCPDMVARIQAVTQSVGGS